MRISTASLIFRIQSARTHHRDAARSTSPLLLVGSLFLAACGGATATAGTDALDGVGDPCATGDDCPTQHCVLGTSSSWCTKECSTDADCPSNMFCVTPHASSTSRCDPLDNAVGDCTQQCDAYHSLQCATSDVLAKCEEACSKVTVEQRVAFLHCAAPETSSSCNSSCCGTSCIDALCSQANITCQ